MLNRFRKLGIKQLWDRKFVRTKSSGKDVIISDKDVLFSYKSKVLNLENEGFTDVIIYNKGDLEAMKLKELQAMAKELKINLKGKRRKHQVVNIMFAYFLQLKSCFWCAFLSLSEYFVKVGRKKILVAFA